MNCLLFRYGLRSGKEYGAQEMTPHGVPARLPPSFRRSLRAHSAHTGFNHLLDRDSSYPINHFHKGLDRLIRQRDYKTPMR